MVFPSHSSSSFSLSLAVSRGKLIFATFIQNQLVSHWITKINLFFPLFGQAQSRDRSRHHFSSLLIGPEQIWPTSGHFVYANEQMLQSDWLLPRRATLTTVNSKYWCVLQPYKHVNVRRTSLLVFHSVEPVRNLHIFKLCDGVFSVIDYLTKYSKEMNPLCFC